MARAKKRVRVRTHRPRVIRKGGDILLVLEHCDPRHQAKYAEDTKLFEDLPREKVEPKFSVTGKGFAFFSKVEAYETAHGEVAVEGEGNVHAWRHYNLKVEF